MEIKMFVDDVSRLIELMEGFSDLSHIDSGDTSSGLRVLRRQMNSIDNTFATYSDDVFKTLFTGRKLGNDIFLANFDNPISSLIRGRVIQYLNEPVEIPLGIEVAVERFFTDRNLVNWSAVAKKRFAQSELKFGSNDFPGYSIRIKPVSEHSSIVILEFVQFEKIFSDQPISVAVSYIRYHAGAGEVIGRKLVKGILKKVIPW